MKLLLKIFMTISILLCPKIMPAEEEVPIPCFSGSVTVISEYIYRGLAQSANRPAVQGGFDYSHSSGLYLGNWNSNISWLTDSGLGVISSIEMDLYGGYRTAISAFSFDLGGLLYHYPGQYSSMWKEYFENPDTFELYAAIAYKWVNIKYSHALSNLFGGRDTAGSGYLEMNLNVNVTKTLLLASHLGHQMVKNFSAGNYTDWKVSASYDTGFAVLGLACSGTDTDMAIYTNPICPDLGQTRLLLFITRTL